MGPGQDVQFGPSSFFRKSATLCCWINLSLFSGCISGQSGHGRGASRFAKSGIGMSVWNGGSWEIERTKLAPSYWVFVNQQSTVYTGRMLSLGERLTI